MTDERIGDWLHTFTGRHFYPLDPRSEDVTIEDIAHALANICRYNGHTRRFYSVAEHSLLLCQELTRLCPNDTQQQLQALMHDAAEAYLCDIVRPVKGMLTGYVEAEQRVELSITIRFGLGWVGKSPLVDELDGRIIYDEAAALLPVEDDPWHLKLGPPLGVEIRGMLPLEAEHEFLEAFRQRWTGQSWKGRDN